MKRTNAQLLGDNRKLLLEIETLRAERDKYKQDMNLAVSSAGKDLIQERDQLRIKLAASEAREIQLRGALEKVKTQNYTDSLNTPMRLSNAIDTTIDQALSFTSPPPLLSVLKEVDSALAFVAAYLEHTGQVNLADRMDKVLASLRQVLGGRG